MTYLKRTLFTILIIVVGLVVILYTFYSSSVANKPSIIKLRNFFFVKMDLITPEWLFIYKLRPTAYNDGKYTYKFPGKFKEIDFANSTITLADLYGKEWNFKYFENKPQNGVEDGYKYIDYDYILRKRDKTNVSRLSKITIDKFNPRITLSPFAKNDVIVLFWSDARTLIEINQANKNGENIVLNGAKLIQINKVVWE